MILRDQLINSIQISFYQLITWQLGESTYKTHSDLKSLEKNLSQKAKVRYMDSSYIKEIRVEEDICKQNLSTRMPILVKILT